MNKLFFSCLLIALSSVVSYGQNLSGTVTDKNQEVVANGTVSLIDTATRVEFSTKTNNNGEFSFKNLKQGVYRLNVDVKGFATFTEIVDINDDIAIEVILEHKKLAAIVSVNTGYLAGSNEVLERTPGAYQAIGKEELETAKVLNFAEVLRRVTGVNVRSEEGFGLRPNISIRGSDPTRSRKILLLEDGIPLSYAPYGDNSSYYHPPLERFESVEVLKGSGQIEYGPVTVAGVVNYVTPDPTEKSAYTLKLIGGTRDYFNGSAGYSGKFRQTGIVLNFTRKQGEGARENLRAGVNDLSAKVVQTINDSSVLTINYSHFDESSQLTYSGLTGEEFALNPRQNPFINDDLEFFREGFSVSHTGVLNPKLYVVTNFYTSYFSRDWWRQSSNSNQRPNRLNADPDCLSMADLNTTCGNQGNPRDFRTIGFEPRLKMQTEFGDFRAEFNSGFRLHYETQNRRAWNGFTPDAREAGSEITEHNHRNAFAVSAFIQNRFIWKNLSLTPGLRIEKVNYERTNLLNAANAKTELTQLIPGFGVAYNPSRNVTIFAGVHRGFAPPSTSDILTNNGGVIDLDPELSWSYELGIRTRPTESVSFEATFFRNDYKNQIIPSSVAGGVGSTQTNAGETLQQGLELNTRIDTNRLFTTDYNVYFQTAYTFLAKARFDGVRYSSVSDFENILVSGNRLPYTPKHLATTSVGFVYRNFEGFIENIFISKHFSDDLNTINPIPNGQRGLIGSQTSFNTTLNYRVERFHSTFFIASKNIFDRLFIVDRTRGIYPGSPRTIQFGWKWNFTK